MIGDPITDPDGNIIGYQGMLPTRDPDGYITGWYAPPVAVSNPFTPTVTAAQPVVPVYTPDGGFIGYTANPALATDYLDPNWQNQPGGTGYFLDSNGNRTAPTAMFFKSRPDAKYDPVTKVVTIGTQFVDLGIAAQQNASGINGFIESMIGNPYWVLGLGVADLGLFKYIMDLGTIDIPYDVGANLVNNPEVFSTLPPNTVSQLDSIIDAVQNGTTLPANTTSVVDSFIDHIYQTQGLPPNSVSAIDSFIDTVQSGQTLPADAVSKIDSIVNAVQNGATLPPDTITKLDSLIESIQSGGNNVGIGGGGANVFPPPGVDLTKIATALIPVVATAGLTALQALTRTALNNGVIPPGYKYNPQTGLLTPSTGSSGGLFSSGSGSVLPLALAGGALLLLMKGKNRG